MWKAIIGKSFERSEASTSQSSRRKDEVDKTAYRHRSSESIVSSNSAGTPIRGKDRDRGFNPSSTSYSSTSRTAYPGTAPASVASSYATALSNQAEQPFTPPGLVRNASLADKMPKPRGSRDERRRDSDRGQRGERRERSTSRERQSNHRERSRSGDREDKRRSARRRYDEQQPGRDLARGLSRSGDGYIDDQGTTRAGDYSVQASGNFGTQVGSSSFTQFPGQYDGGLPGFAPSPSPVPVSMSSHVPDQFPGQFPSQAAAPYRPPLAATEGGPGLAAEYYGDAGESVAHQPGVRPQAPTLIVGAEPHLQAASPIAAPPPEPSATGNVGAAASFFSGADDYQPLPSSKPPKPGKQSKPDNTNKPNRPSGAAVVTGSAALGFAASSSGTSTAHGGPGGTPNSSLFQGSANVPARPSVGYPPSTTGQSTSHHSSSAPAIPTLGAAAVGATAGYMIGHHSSSQQSPPSRISSSGNAGIHDTAPPQRPESQRPHSQAHPTYVPIASNGRPDHPGKHSSQSNVPLYAAGLAGTAGAAAAAYQSHHSPSHNSYNNPYNYPYNHPYASGSMAQRHRHRGPLSELIDFLRDPDGVAEFEEYTEYIGVCKHCFLPGSSPRDAPRKHHYRRRGSNERYGSSTLIDKESRYWSSDGESRRTKGRSWLATGMAGYGLGKIGKSFSRTPENDFGDYGVRSGRGNQSSWSLTSRISDHSDRRGQTSHGVTRRSSDTGSRYRSRSRERVETGITSEGKLYKKDRHGSLFGGPTMTTYEARRRPSRSRSFSRDRRSGVTGAAIGAIIGSSAATSTVRRRSRSPEKRFAKTKRRSREQSPSSGSKHGKGASYSSHGGPLAPSSPYIDSSRLYKKASNTVSGGFFSSRPENASRRKTKKSKGFFSFSNSSSSSSDAGLAYGSAFERRMSSKQPRAKWKNSRDINAAILGLGAAAAALAVTDQSSARQRRRRPDLVAVKEPRYNHGKSSERSRKSRRPSTSSSSEDGVWEDASEDDDSSSVSSGLAYGGAARKSQESLLSEASGTSKWGWRWGSSKKKKDPGYSVNNVGGTSASASAAVGGLGAHVTGEPAAFDNRRDGAMSSVSSLPSMQHVYPIPTSDPSRFDISRQSSTMSTSLPMVTSRPTPIPLQQPQPIAPVSPAVYTIQAPYGHSYSAPTGPPVFSGVVSRPRPAVTEGHQARITGSPDRTLPGSFPFQESELQRLPREASSGKPHRRRDSSPASRTEIVEPSSSSRRKRASTQSQGSSVRFDVVKEQADKERRNRRRQEEEEDEINRQQLLLREAKDRKDREKQHQLRLKEEEDAKHERFRLEEIKKQSERHDRDKRRILKEETLTQEHASLRKLENQAETGGERQRREFGSSNKALVGTKRDENVRSETQPHGNHGRALGESKNSASWAAPGVIGAAAAVIVASAAEKKASSAEESQAKRRHEQRSIRDGSENGNGKTKSSKRQSPSEDNDDMRDREAPAARKVGPKAAPSSRHEDYATYFAPIELLARIKNQQPGFDLERDDDGAPHQKPHIITIEPAGRKSLSYSPADASNEVPYGRGPNRVSTAWAVPALNLIEPTPPHSIAGSSRGDASPIMRPEDATTAEINQPEKPSTASKVTWGEPETVEYTVITPLESREEFISKPDKPPTLEEVIEVVTIAPAVAPSMAGTDVRDPMLPVDEVIVRHMPGEFGDDLEFAATLAAGLQDTGFDPAIVIDDPTYRRRDSPPGSESTNFYRQPFFETETDLGLDSPGTEGAPPQRGFIEGELPSTPQDEEIPTASGNFDIPLKKQLNKKEKRKQNNAATSREMDGFSTTGSSPSKPSPRDDILREPVTFSEEPESIGSIPSGPSDVLVGPANSSRPEGDNSRKRTERAKSTSPRSVSRSRTDSQGYFDDQQTTPTSSIHKTEQDARITDLAANVPLPEDKPDDQTSVKGPSMDNSRYNRVSTDEAENPLSRHGVVPTGFPDTEGIGPETSPDFTHNTEEFGTRTKHRRNSQDDSPSRKYADFSTRFSPDTQEAEEQGKRKKWPKPASVPDDLSDRDSRSISTPATEPDEYRKSRKGKKKSKRDSAGYDDAVSAASAPAAFENDETLRSKSKKDKKGGLFGLFGSSKSYEEKPETRKAPSEVTVEDFQESKKTKRKSKNRSSSGDVYNLYGAAAQSVGDLSQLGQPREDSDDRESQRSRDKEERRRSRKGSTVESGITTQELPSKDEHRTSPIEGPRQGTPLDNPMLVTAESQDNLVSFLEAGNDIPSVPDGVEPALSTQTGEDPSQAPLPALQYRTPFSEPSVPATVRTPSPHRSDLSGHAVKLPQDPPVSPSFAPVPREQRLPGLQSSDQIPISPALPSPTAIPLHFRTPRPSAGFVRSSPLSSPAMAPNSPSSVVPRTRHARPGSTEFRPLWLVERHKSREQFDPEEPYPSLPSSKTTSRSSSVHEPEDVNANDEMTSGPSNGNFVLRVDAEHSSEPQEFLDSQQPTPVATSFPLAVQHDENPDAELHGPLDAEYNHAAYVNRPDSLTSAPSSPPLRSLGDTTSKSPDNVLPANFEDLRNLPPLPPSSSSSSYGDEELLSSSAIKDAAVAMGTLMGDAATAVLGRDRSSEQTSLPSDSSNYIHSARDIVLPLDTARSQQKSIEAEIEPDLPPTDKPSEGPYSQAELSTTSLPDQGASLDDDLTDPVTPSQAASLISAEQERELQEQDAQDAVDTWFAPPTSKKGKKEKQSKNQKKSSILKNNGASKASPSVSTSSSALTAAAPLVAVETLTEEDHDFALPGGLTGSQSDQMESNPAPVPLLEHEAEQDESGAHVLPPLEPVEDEAEWPDRSRKAKKGKGKKRDNKQSKMATKSVEAVPSNREQEPQLVLESFRDQDVVPSKIMEGAEDGRLGIETRASEDRDVTPDVLAQDELSIVLPSATPLESEAVSEYSMPSKRTKKDKKKAKQARQADPAMELAAKDSPSAADIGFVDDESRLVRNSSQPEDLEIEPRLPVSNSVNLVDTSSNIGSVVEFTIPARRKGKAKKKQKLDLRSGRELSFGVGNPATEEDAPRQPGAEPASITSERSIAAKALQHTEPGLEPEPTLEVTDTATVSSAGPDEPTQQNLDSGHAFAIPAKETTRSNVQELSPLISAYPLPDDAPGPFPLEHESSRSLSPAMVPLPEDEDLGLYDVPTVEELPQEAEVSWVMPQLKAETEDVLQENSLSPTRGSVSGAPGAFPTDQSSSIQVAPETLPFPPDKDGELDHSPESMPLNETPGAFPTKETPSVEETSQIIPLAPDTDVELDHSPESMHLDDTPGAFPTEETPSVQEAPEMNPLLPDKDRELNISPVLKPLDETPGAFPTEGMPSVQEVRDLVPLPSDEGVKIDRSPILESLSETPGAFPIEQSTSAQIPLPSDQATELSRSATLKPLSETPGAFPTRQSPSAQGPLPSDEDVELDRSATLKPFSDTPGTFPTGQNPSVPVMPEVKPLLGYRGVGLKNSSDDNGPRSEIAGRASNDSGVMPAVTAKNDDTLRQDDGSSTLMPLADELPGGFPTEYGSSVHVIPKMVPLPPDEDTSHTDPLNDTQSRSDITAYTSELDEFTSGLRVEESGHMRQEDNTSKAVILDTELPGAFPTEQKTPVEVTPDQVPLPPDENMDVYNPQDDDEFSVYTKHDDEGIERTLSSSVLATPAVELPGAFPAGQSTPAQDFPEDVPRPPDQSVNLGDRQAALPSPEHARADSDDNNDRMRRQASASELATPAAELPGAFPVWQGTLVKDSPEDVPARSNEGVDLCDRQGNLQSPEYAKADNDDQNDGTRRKASSSELATPAVELPGAFPADKSTSVEISPEDIPLPPDENMDVYNPLEDDQYITTPAIELPGAFPGELSLPMISPTEKGTSSQEPKSSQSTVDDEQSQQNAVADDRDIQSHLTTLKPSPEGEKSPKTSILPILKSLLPAVSTSARTEPSPSAVSPESVPLPDNLDVDLDDISKNKQPSMESTYAVSVVSAAEHGPESVDEEGTQQGTTSLSAPKNPSTENLVSNSTGQGPKRSLSLTSALPPYDVTYKPLLSETLPLPEKTDVTPRHITEPALPEDVDHENAITGQSPLPGNVNVIPEIATSIPLPEGAHLELLPPEIIPLPETADAVYPLADTIAQADAAYFESSPSEIVPRPEDTERETLAPRMVPLPYDADSDLQEPSLCAEPLPTADQMSVETEPSLEEPRPKSILEAREHTVERASEENPASEQAEEATADEFFVPSRKKGKKAKKQRSALAYIEDEAPTADVIEEPPSTREVKVHAQPETTAAETGEPSGVLADRNQADDQLDRQEASAVLDTVNALTDVQRSTKKGKKNKKNRNLPTPFEGQTTLSTPDSLGMPLEIPGDPKTSTTELPDSVQVPQPSGDNPREVQSDLSTPSEGPLGRPLDLMKGLLGMSTKQKKKKGKKDKYLQDFESSSAVSEDPMASAESNPLSFEEEDVFEGNGGFETKQSKESKKGKKGKVDISTGTKESTASAINNGLPATPHAIAVEDPMMAEDQRPFTTIERPENEPDRPTKTLSKSSDQEAISAPPLDDSVVLAEPWEGDVNVKPEPWASDADYLHEAVESQLPPDDPADFLVEEQNIEPEAELYEPSFSLRKSKNVKKKAKKKQAAVHYNEQPKPIALPDTSYQRSTADISLELPDAAPKVVDEPYRALPFTLSPKEPRELTQPLPNVKGSLGPFTISGPPEDSITLAAGPGGIPLHTADVSEDEHFNEAPVKSNEASDESHTTPEKATSIEGIQQQPSVEPHNLYASDPSDARSFTTIPSDLDAGETHVVSELLKAISEEPNVDNEQPSAFNQEYAAAEETPTATDLELTALEAGLLKSNESPVVYSTQQPAITSHSIEPVNSQQEDGSWATESSRKAKKSKKRQKGALVSTQPEGIEETTSDLYAYPDRSSALLGPSHELNRSGEEGLRKPTSYDTVLDPSSVEGAESQPPKLDEDPEGRALDGNGFKEAFSRSLGENPSDVVLGMNAASHTKPDTVNESVNFGTAGVHTLTEEYPAEDIVEDHGAQEDEWPGGFTTKAKHKKGKKQRQNDRSLLAAELTEGPSTSSTSTETPRDGSISPNHQVVPQELEAPMQSNTAIISLQNAPVASVVDEPVMPRQDDDFVSYTSTKKGKKGKKSKKQPPNRAWYDETTGSGASTPAEAQAPRSEPPEAEISRDKVENVFAEPPAQIHAVSEMPDVVLDYPAEPIEVSGEPEAESMWAPASKKGGKKGKKSSKQNQGYGISADPILKVLPEPADKSRDTAERDTTAVLRTEDAGSADELILDDLPALPPSRPESRMSDAAEKARTEDNLLREQAVFEPLPTSRPTSPTALPFESAAHTQFHDEQLKDEITPANPAAFPESRPDSPVMTAPEILTQARLHDKHTDPEIPGAIQSGVAPRKSSLPLRRSSEPHTLIQENVISTNSSEPAQSDGFLDSSIYLGSQNTPDVEAVETSEADEYTDMSHFDQAPRPFDGTIGLTTMETLHRQPAKEMSKKEKRKNKKQKKTINWAEEEESIPTQSTSVTSDKELEPQDEWNGLPSTTSASRGLEAEQPQQLDIQSRSMPSQDSPIVSLSGHALEHRIHTPEKILGVSQFNRDSAVHVSDSPLLPYIVPEYKSVRDSGYQDTTASPVVRSTDECATGSELQSPLQDIRRSPSADRLLTDPHSTGSFAPVDRGPGLESIPSSRNPLRTSVELGPAYEVSVSRHPAELPRSPINSGGSVNATWDMPDSPNEFKVLGHRSDQPREHDSVLLPQHDQRQPSPVESATKDRSSVLFLSSPSTREDSTDQPTTQSPWEGIYHSAEETSQITPIDAAKRTGGDVEITEVPNGPRELSEPQAAAAERDPNPAASNSLSEISETPSTSLFGGPVGINSDNPFEGSPPPASLGFNGSERTPLDTIAEHSTKDSPLLKKSRALSDIGSPERGNKSMRRSATPQSHGQGDLQLPPVRGRGITLPPQRHATPPDSGILSTDDFIARLSWPAVDEDSHSVDLDRVKSRNTDRRTTSHSNGSARVRDGEIRSASGQSIRSGGSIIRFRTPDRDQIVRPASGVSNRSASGTGTPPLRRVDRRLSGDLRAANKRSEANFLAKQPDLGFDVDPHIPSSSTYDPVKDKGKGRVRGMNDVYEGWGDVPGSPLSPTRPPSVRRRQSIQIIDLETKLDQLASENRLLQDAKSKAERGIQELGYAHNRNENAAREALETRDLHLREKDSEILKLRETLEWVQKEVARLTEVNESLAATNLSLSSNQDHRYSQLQLEHDTTKQQWQQSTRELEELRQQHVHLSTGMEDIVRHEISIALDDKNAEVRRLRDELEAAKEQVRALQQQILASKPSDDVLITRDEDYFDSQCQQLCQHVQQWVMRFSKFSDSKPCRLTSEVTDEKIMDRFDNAILDGSDVDNYLADRKRRRDVFMSVVMTMVWDFIFTRYLFGMDREQRQKLKSLEKLLGEVGPMKAVHRWRATTLMLLSRRQTFQAQRAQDTEAVVQEIFQTLSTFLPPSSQYIKQAKESLRNVMRYAVDLSIEMRTQRAEYVMLPPLQPEYDTNGDLVRKVYFNAAVMNERSGNTTSNEELEAQHAVVRIVLFPLVVKKGDDAGLGNEEIVVCPAQVLVAKPGKEKKVVRVLSGDRMSVDQATKSVLSFAPSSMDMGNMI